MNPTPEPIVPGPRSPRWRSAAYIGAVISALSLVMVTVPFWTMESGLIHPDFGLFVIVPILSFAFAVPLAGLMCAVAIVWGIRHDDTRTIAWGASGVVVAAIAVAVAADIGWYSVLWLR